MKGCFVALGWVVLAMVVLFIAAGLGAFGSAPRPAAVAATAAPAPTKAVVTLVPVRAADPVLSLVSTSGSTQGTRWFVVQGMVKNLTNQPIPNVAAVVIIDGAADEAMISYNPIKAGETSPFKVMVARETPAATWQVQFKQIGRGSLPSN